ncbi:MAG TPA: tetratricopeptide repeat protein [Candidatus Dormibacteraeota bacterium]|nr:tetratricopeptide repeat protein [Candidatus Dormibacteraeota bacterium]
MSANSNSRRQKLEAFLASHPDDAFGRYGLAMECAREGDTEAALENFRRLLESHPDYVAGYFQYGQLLAKLGRSEPARQTLAAGIATAQRLGDTHAAAEMQAALDSLA